MLEVEEVFQNMLDARSRASFVGKRLIVDWQSPSRCITTEELIVKKAPDKLLIEILAPSELHGTKMIENAGRRWVKNVTRDESLPPPPQPPEFRGREQFLKDVSLLKRNYNVTVSMGGNLELSNESNIIAGRKAYLVEITPKHPGRPAKKLWLDAQKNVVLRMEDYSSDGRLISLLVYTEINFQKKIDEKLFAITPSARRNDKRRRESEPLSLVDAQKQSHFPILSPKYLPEGFVFEDVRIIKRNGTQYVHLHYIDGLTVLSLFESRANDANRLDKPPPPKAEGHQGEEISIGEVNCQIFSPGRERILHWTTKSALKSGAGLNFTLIGEISKSEMIAIAESLILGE
ncbi:DUF4367 domain-containing protein [bacterium]|nr:DUF4367 domain-containing protein [bacterium]